MKITEERKKEVMRLLQKIDEKQWRTVQDVMNALTTEPTPEEKAATAERKAEAARKKIENCKAFDNFRDKKLKGLVMPSRYDFSYNELTPIMPHVMRSSLELEPVLNGLSFMYGWGFKRGMAYSKAQAKKEAALHAANMKNGLDHSTDEI